MFLVCTRLKKNLSPVRLEIKIKILCTKFRTQLGFRIFIYLSLTGKGG